MRKLIVLCLILICQNFIISSSLLSMKNQNHFESLPDEMISEIFKSIDNLDSFRAFCKTCKRFYNLNKSKAAQEHLYHLLAKKCAINFIKFLNSSRGKNLLSKLQLSQSFINKSAKLLKSLDEKWYDKLSNNRESAFLLLHLIENYKNMLFEKKIQNSWEKTIKENIFNAFYKFKNEKNTLIYIELLDSQKLEKTYDKTKEKIGALFLKILFEALENKEFKNTIENTLDQKSITEIKNEPQNIKESIELMLDLQSTIINLKNSIITKFLDCIPNNHKQNHSP